MTLPEAITAPRGDGGSVNVFASDIVLVLGVLVMRGVRLTARTNIYLVSLTILALVAVIGVGAAEVDTDNRSPYFPSDWAGVREGAALLFFAYIGFDIGRHDRRGDPAPAARHADRDPRLARRRDRAVHRGRGRRHRDGPVP